MFEPNPEPKSCEWCSASDSEHLDPYGRWIPCLDQIYGTAIFHETYDEE